jgi:hypothetical protein
VSAEFVPAKVRRAAQTRGKASDKRGPFYKAVKRYIDAKWGLKAGRP